MFKNLWIILILIIISCIIGLWYLEGGLSGGESLIDKENKRLVQQLKDLYSQEEFMENQIRIMRQNKEDYALEQKSLDEIRSSIEKIRDEISKAKAVSQAKPPTVDKKQPSIQKLISSRAFVLATVIVLGLIILLLIRGKAFGRSKTPVSLPGIPAQGTVRSAKPPRARPESPPPVYEDPKPYSPPSRATPSPNERIGGGPPKRQGGKSTREQVLDLARNGHSPRDISNALKIGQDEVQLILKLGQEG